MSARVSRSLLLAALCGLVLATAPPTRADETRKGRSGTAFVVHKDGLLVTCAHVIRGATEVEVVLGGSTLAAQVVAQDQIRDLALLQVKAKNLKPLTLRTSPGILGQEVRAFGYPMTMALGESLKVTRGSFSGYGAGEVPPLIIDVPINPGNSGGPLVNERGEVIGVISAKIAAPGVTNVGFAVGVPDLQAMMETTRKDFKLEKSKKEGKPLPGTELVQKVSPSVALVLAWSDGNSPTASSPSLQSSPASPLSPTSPPPTQTAQSEKAVWELTNGTATELVLTVEGPENQQLTLAPGKTKVLLLPAGDYEITIPSGDSAQPFNKTYRLRTGERLQTRFAFN